jgi:23S rRNA pseudouridine1911/1915/1917 synthase
MKPSPRTALDWLLTRFPETSKRRAKEWIESGRVRINGRFIRRPNEILENGIRLELLPRADIAVGLEQPLQINAQVTLVHLDSALAVIDKAPGILAVPSVADEPSALGVIAEFLRGRIQPVAGRERFREVSELRRSFGRLSPRRVHRIDKHTSGLVCFAMSAVARAHLIDQFQEHSITRQYVAFVDGRLSTGRGTWRHWLQTVEGQTRQRVITVREAKSQGAEMVEAVTHFEVLTEFPLKSGRTVSKLRLTLETGRTHQIRAQAAAAGVPVIGDRLYHADYSSQKSGHAWGVVAFDRQALHAERLGLAHPEPPHKRMEWTSPLSEDLQRLEKILRRMCR